MNILKDFFKNTFSSPAKPSVSKKINLLIEVGAFDKGGMEKVVLDMAIRLDPDVYKVVIACMGKTGYWGDIAVQKGIKVVPIEGLNRDRQYKNLLKQEQINLSNSHFSDAGYALFKDLGIPNVTFIHNVYAFLPDKVIKRLRTNDRYIDTYISVSQNATRYAVQKLKLPSEKFVTIPNGLIIHEHQDRLARAAVVTRESLGISDSDYVFLNVASYNLHKGHYLMADAMKKILKGRQDIKILCLGNIIFPPHVEGLTAYLKDNGLDRHILMPGYFPNVESFYRISDAFLLPSFIEGWSIAMNEAMFYEKPMILTDTGASAEVIENNDIGILLENEYGDILNLDSKTLDACGYDQREYKTSENLANAMMTFADNREHWKQAGRKGKEKLMQKYDFDTIVRKYEDVFASAALGANR